MLLLPAAATAQNATTPGAVTTPYPTLINLSVEWAISGDDDNDGVVGARFRPTGTGQWRDALPLRRVPAGRRGRRSARALARRFPRRGPDCGSAIPDGDVAGGATIHIGPTPHMSRLWIRNEGYQ